MARDDVTIRIGGESRGFDQALRRSRRQVDRYGRGVTGVMRRAGSRIAGGLKRSLINPLTGALSAGALFAAGREIVNFDSKLARMAIQSRLSAEEQARLREEIMAVSDATGQGRNDILAGLDAIVQRTGDVKFAWETMRDLGYASSATGAEMEYLGALASNLQQKLDLAGSQIMPALNILTVQGKQGAFTLENMADQGERLFAAAGRLDMSGLDDLRRFGSLVQIARMGTSSAEQAATAVERVVANILAKQDQIRKMGFSIFTNEQTKELKRIDDIIKGVVTAAEGDSKVLGQIFGEEGIRAVSTIAKAYRQTKGFALFDELMTADAGRAGELMRDFARYSEEGAFTFKRLGNLAIKFADIGLKGPIEDLGNALEEFLEHPERIRQMEESIRDLADAMGTLVKWGTKAAGLFGKSFGRQVEETKRMHFKGNLFDLIGEIPEGRRKKLMAEYNVDTDLFRRGPLFIPRDEQKDFFNRLVGVVSAYAKAKPYWAEKTGASDVIEKSETLVNVYIDRDNRVSADTQSSRGTSRTRIHNRGSFGPVRVAQ